VREKTDSRRGGAAAPDDEGPFCMLHLYSSRRVLPDQANLVVDEIKKNILEATEECGAKQTDLFYAGPATIALFLGHRWNPIPAVQCYEYIGRTEKYVPSCFLKPGATNIPQTGMNAR